MAQEPQTAQERARQLLRATLTTSKWLPTTQEQRLVWAIRIAVVLGVLVAIGNAYDKNLWDWLKLLRSDSDQQRQRWRGLSTLTGAALWGHLASAPRAFRSILRGGLIHDAYGTDHAAE
jgi:hypothetical protein